jgi:hypothetical protein
MFAPLAGRCQPIHVAMAAFANEGGETIGLKLVGLQLCNTADIETQCFCLAFQELFGR